MVEACMNYYPFHIGDYLSATRHLSWEEDAAYRRLLDTYYTTEKPLPVDLRSVCRLVMATTDGQRESVQIVLEEFFIETPEGWVNRRADRIIRSHNLRHGANHYIRFRRAVFDRDGHHCAYCGVMDAPLELDHIVPRSRGGADHPDNLTPACKPCNTSKGAKYLQDWLATR